MPGALQSRSAENARTCMQRQVPGARAAGPGRPRVQTAVPALGNAAGAQSVTSAAGTERVFGARDRRKRPCVRLCAHGARSERAHAGRWRLTRIFQFSSARSRLVFGRAGNAFWGFAGVEVMRSR